MRRFCTRKGGEFSLFRHIWHIIIDLPRHSSFRYICKGTLTPDYFAAAHDSFDDPYVYIVISRTGSAASEIISKCTRNQHTHVSLSFDVHLNTLISYNGGEGVNPPGLNMEKMEYLNKKPRSSVIVYRLAATQVQKGLILEKIREINEQGSAYNVIGLALKFSFKPNILFCSQFVYKMLKHANLDYFARNDVEVRPSDFIDLDEHQKLHFVYEILVSNSKQED